MAMPLTGFDDDPSSPVMREETVEFYRKRTPSTRLGEPRDIAAMACFLLADEAEWINGQAISVDGGSVMHG